MVGWGNPTWSTHSTAPRPTRPASYDPGEGLPGRVYQQAYHEWIPDLAADVRSLRSRAAAGIGLHVAVGVPICSAGRTLGALCVYGDHIEDPEESLTALLTGIAAQIGQYLERRRAEATGAQRACRQWAASPGGEAGVDDVLARTGDLDGYAFSVPRGGRRATGCRSEWALPAGSDGAGRLPAMDIFDLF
jgi:GAF domain-containing protein